MDNKKYIAVGYEIDGDKVNFTINQLPGDEPVDVKTMAQVLCGGLSLLIKCANQEGKIKDYELMEIVIDILNSEFVNYKSFGDATIHNKFRGEF